MEDRNPNRKLSCRKVNFSTEQSESLGNASNFGHAVISQSLPIHFQHQRFQNKRITGVATGYRNRKNLHQQVY
jgi:hypothetical protein